MNKLTLNDIARVCHEVNRAYCQALGDNSQVEWNRHQNGNKIQLNPVFYCI